MVTGQSIGSRVQQPLGMKSIGIQGHPSVVPVGQTFQGAQVGLTVPYLFSLFDLLAAGTPDPECPPFWTEPFSHVMPTEMTCFSPATCMMTNPLLLSCCHYTIDFFKQICMQKINKIKGNKILEQKWEQYCIINQAGANVVQPSSLGNGGANNLPRLPGLQNEQVLIDAYRRNTTGSNDDSPLNDDFYNMIMQCQVRPAELSHDKSRRTGEGRLVELSNSFMLSRKNVFIPMEGQYVTNSFIVYLMLMGYNIIRLYRTRLYRNSTYIEVQSAVPLDTMSLQEMIGYIETWIYRSVRHGPLNFDITGLYCISLIVFLSTLCWWEVVVQPDD